MTINLNRVVKAKKTQKIIIRVKQPQRKIYRFPVQFDPHLFDPLLSESSNV